MYLTPYDTTAGSNVRDLDKLRHALERAVIEGSLGSINTTTQVKCVADNSDYTRDIPPFNHPMVLKDKTVVIDLRPFQNRVMKDANGVVTIPDGGFATLLLKQALMQCAWMEDSTMLSSISDLPLQVYSNWVAGTISRRLNLPLIVEQDVMALAAWFHLCQYEQHTSQTIDDPRSTEILRKVTKISRTTYTKAERIIELIDMVGYVRTIGEFVEAVQKLDDRRIMALNPTLFFNLLASGWFGGPAAREITAISTEYPPYFISMVHTAINEKMYRKTPINEMAMRFNRGDAFGKYNNAFRNIIRSLED